ncbi:MAG: N-acetylglucosamine-6-phosphate deacetylase [Slackia sp.]|nr:N-acetylglucosamine-6-phosphate deacetylase [Slackia sp.]
MSALKITGARVFDGDAFVARDLFVDDGRIVEEAPEGDVCVIDAAGCYAIPGLVDVHSHGAVGYDFCDGTHEAIDAICRYQASRGVTAYCPATMTYPEEKLAGIARCAAEHVDAPDAAALVGINMEGPYISPSKVGAQNPAYVQAPDAAMFERLQDAAGGLFKIVDIAPEVPAALDFVKAQGDKVRISIAHTCATYDEAKAAFDAGAKHVTHLFNAMPPLAHREPGVIGAAADAGATPEIITDGVHIHPAAVRAAFKLFGDDKMILISDSMMATGLDDGEYSLGGQAVTVRGNRATLHDGTLAGSATDLMGCFRVAVRDMEIPLVSAVKAASCNPARALGLEGERGTLAAGAIADIVLLNEGLDIEHVVLRGNVL